MYIFDHVTEQDGLMDYTLKLANKILKNGPSAIEASLECINIGLDTKLSDGLRYEVEKFASLFGSDEQQEGTTAFVEKRKPEFRN